MPLSPSFPSSEIRYILENSEARLLLSPSKFQSKAEEVIREGLQQPPTLVVINKQLAEAEEKASESVQLDDTTQNAGGMMLYTSGTTSRPASHTLS